MARVTDLGLPVTGQRFALEQGPESGTVAILRLADGAQVGTFALEPDGPRPTIHSLCINEADRSYGAGSESALLLVQAAEAAGFEELRAWAHPNLGLSAYFWGRMGLRPLHGPGPEGGIWYERVFAPFAG